MQPLLIPPSILLTGSAGFIGQSCLRWLQKRKQTFVHGIDRVSEEDRAYHSDQFSYPDNPLRFERKPTLILHLGAITDTSCKNMPELIKWNTESSKFYWSLARDLGIPFVYASSAATYGSGDQGFSDRLSQLEPTNPYGKSKLSFDQWALAQSKTPPRWIGWKFFNVFGDLEHHKGPMQSFVFKSLRTLQKQGRMTLFRSNNGTVPDGEQARDFVFVEDVISVLFKALAHPLMPSGIYNLGTGHAETFRSIATKLLGLIPGKIDWVDTPPQYQAHYQYFTQADLTTWSQYGFTHKFLETTEALALTKRGMEYLTKQARRPTLPQNGILREKKEDIYG